MAAHPLNLCPISYYFLTDIVMASPKGKMTTSKDIELEVKEWLRHAKERAANKEKKGTTNSAPGNNERSSYSFSRSQCHVSPFTLVMSNCNYIEGILKVLTMGLLEKFTSA